MDHGANLNLRADPAPLREGVASTKVSLIGSVSVVCAILSSHRARDLAQGLGGACSVPWGVNQPKDVVKREANHARNESLWVRKERKTAQSAAHRVAKERGEDTPTESDSSNEEEEEGEVNPAPLSPSCPTPSPFGDIIGR
jgi:hypothetical protein